MAKIKGGRKRPDKGPGRNHWSPRKGINAHRTIGGQSTDSHGNWRSTDGAIADSKMRTYYDTMSQIRQVRNERNVSARNRRGCRGGKKPYAA